ncbi:DUF2784 family protein, partial [Candidatus Gracilibacteria bacterium]|nr:DUF2784 family protein [Candidatus Gracilibacteria bacterium]
MSALSTLAADTVMSIHFFAIIFLFIGWLSTRAKIRRLHLIMTVAGLVSQLITGACPLWTLESSLRGIDAGKGFLNHYGIMLPFGATFAILFGILMVSFMRNFASRRLPILQAITGVLVMIVVMGYGECFIAGTEILMADGSVKPIEEIEIGDTVLGMDGAKNTIVGLYRYRLGAQPLYAINNDGEYFVTAAHPFWTTTGWQAINPAAAEKWNPNLEISRLDEGDILILEDGEKIVKNIRAKQSNYFTTIYNFTTDGNQTYYADGYLVHNKGGGGTGTATGIGDQGNGFAGANGSNGFGGTVGGTTGGNGAIGDCFTGDTPITMADGSHRNIENIRTGDEVLAWDFETDAPVPVEVDWTWRGPHEDMYVINGAINVTAEHPFWTRELGWAAINPKETLRKHNWQPAQLAVGQYFMDAEKNYIEVTSIESNAGEVMTYNFGVPGYKNYFAADVLVHNKDAVPAGCATCIGIECFDLNCPATPA